MPAGDGGSSKSKYIYFHDQSYYEVIVNRHNDNSLLMMSDIILNF
jgi:hypothetical protein